MKDRLHQSLGPGELHRLPLGAPILAPSPGPLSLAGRDPGRVTAGQLQEQLFWGVHRWHRSDVALWEPGATPPSPQPQDWGNAALMPLSSDSSHISSFAGNVGAYFLLRVGLVSIKMSPHPLPGPQAPCLHTYMGKYCKRREH